MRLRTVSRSFVSALFIALAINLALLIAIRDASSQVRHAHQVLAGANALTQQVLRENDLLAQLVQSFTTTGDLRYLTIYYDIVAVREGERAAPTTDDAARYWREVVANRRPYASAGDGLAQSLLERMRRQHFSDAELQTARRMLDVLARMKLTEQIAFAQTQGLYDSQRGEFVSDGKPDMASAVRSVHSPGYERMRADLVAAAGDLHDQVSARTQAAADAARARLVSFIVAAIVVDLVLLPLLLAAALLIRRQVLAPIAQLSAQAGRYSQGDYRDERAAPTVAAVSELDHLGRTMATMAGSIRDELHRRDRLEHELTAAREAAEAATVTKSRFLANMSHEIRTPMNAIMGMTHLVLQSELTAQQRDYLCKAESASRVLLALINDVLDFSKLEAGGMPLESAPLAIEAVVGQAIEMVRQAAHAKELELIADFADPTLLGSRGTLKGDALRLTQVLTNLLSNAVKFTARGQVRLSVSSEAAGGDDQGIVLVLSVRDSGIGMSEPQIASLFQEFVQADVSTTRRYGGTGLGLVITRRLVQLMRGSIGVSSTPGMGSTFTVKLPMQVMPAAAQDGLTAAAARWHVLLVEDQADTSAVLRDQLHGLGIGRLGRLVHVATRAQALHALEQAHHAGQRFDLLMLDWVLPDGEGDAVLGAALQMQPDLHAVVMTAYESDELRTQALAMGARAVLSKPVLPLELRRLARTDSAAPPSNQQPRPAQSLAGLRVLLVEDNAINSELAQELLRRRGARVEHAVNGLQAVERLAADGAQAYDVVLMDLEMPVLDGLEATRRLRREPRFDALPIIAMTAHALPDERERCLAVGMQEHIAKPLNPQALEQALRRYVRPASARPQPAAPRAADASPWPQIEGLDLHAARASFEHHVALYRHTLQMFAAKHGEDIALWARWVHAGRWDELKRAAHTLRGLAGTVGATALRAQLATLERDIQREAAAEVLAALPAAEETLVRLATAIEAELTQPLPWQTGSGALGQLAGDDAPARLDELRALLAGSDSQALHWWQTRQRAMQRLLPSATRRRVDKALAQFDFDAALAALEAADGADAAQTTV